MRRRTSLLALTLVAFGVACSGTTRLSGAALVKEADAICGSVDARIAALPAPDPADPARAAATIADLVALQRAATARLRALRPSAADADRYRRWLGDVGAAVDRVDDVRRAFLAADGPAAASAEIAGRELARRANEAASALGLRRCSITPAVR